MAKQTSKVLNFGPNKLTIKPVDFIHSDQRGWIINTQGTKDNQVNSAEQPRIIASEPRCVRGNHFHPAETETIILINGTWSLVGAQTDGSKPQTLELVCDQPHLIIVEPNIAHAFKNTGSTTAYLYHHSDRPYQETRSKKLNQPLII